MKQSLFHSKYNLQIYQRAIQSLIFQTLRTNTKLTLVLQLFSVDALSNAVNTEVRTANVSAIKSANRSITRIGQIITYTVAVTNAGTIPITNTLLLDAIASGTTFVPNSILVDGVPRPNENQLPVLILI